MFGYGSLARARGGLVELGGLRRHWGVAMDNRVDLPGYKYYVARADGTRPEVFVAYLDLTEGEGPGANGVLLPVDDRELRALDRRERNYERVDVSDRLERPPGRVWAYVGHLEARGRRDEGPAVVSRRYLEDVKAAFRARGEAAYAAFLASSDLGGLPVHDLERIDFPAEPVASDA